MKRIPKQEPRMTMDEYWKLKSEREPLPSMKKPCDDCAMTTGFYVPMADSLLTRPIDIQERVVKSWFCHNHSNRACKGASDYVIDGVRGFD